jgi:citrate synthase
MSQIVLSPGLADVPVAESAVSFIDGKNARLEYRGIAVETLAQESCFEETTYLLLKGDLPNKRNWPTSTIDSAITAASSSACLI